MTNINLNSLRPGPDSNGRFGIHGGRFVAETLMPLVLNVEKSRLDKILGNKEILSLISHRSNINSLSTKSRVFFKFKF